MTTQVFIEFPAVEVPVPEDAPEGTEPTTRPLNAGGLPFSHWFSWLLGEIPSLRAPLHKVALAFKMSGACFDAEEAKAKGFAIDAADWHEVSNFLGAKDSVFNIAPPAHANGHPLTIAPHVMYPNAAAILEAKEVEATS